MRGIEAVQGQEARGKTISPAMIRWISVTAASILFLALALAIWIAVSEPMYPVRHAPNYGAGQSCWTKDMTEEFWIKLPSGDFEVWNGTMAGEFRRLQYANSNHIWRPSLRCLKDVTSRWSWHGVGRGSWEAKLLQERYEKVLRAYRELPIWPFNRRFANKTHK